MGMYCYYSLVECVFKFVCVYVLSKLWNIMCIFIRWWFFCFNCFFMVNVICMLIGYWVIEVKLKIIKFSNFCDIWGIIWCFGDGVNWDYLYFF